MKKNFKMKSVFLIIGALLISCNQTEVSQSNSQTGDESKFPVLKGPYLGQTPPGMIAEIFAPGIVSTHFHEHSFPTFSHDGKEVHWTVGIRLIGQRGGSEKFFQGRILCMKEEDGRWLPPQFTEFNTLFEELEGFFSPDGKKYFFTSRRPIVEGGRGENGVNNIWVIEKHRKEWGEPMPLSSNINTEKSESSPTVTYNGTLYYQGFWEGGEYNCGIYRSELQNGEYSDPELLPESINTPHFDWTPFISPDESYLLFSSNRPGGYGNSDIYFAFRKNDGSWTESINLGPSINSESTERYPYVSPDGKYLFFVSDKFLYENVLKDNYTYKQLLDVFNKPGNGANDIYWVSAKIIEKLKPNELK